MAAVLYGNEATVPVRTESVQKRHFGRSAWDISVGKDQYSSSKERGWCNRADETVCASARLCIGQSLSMCPVSSRLMCQLSASRRMCGVWPPIAQAALKYLFSASR